MQRGNKDNESIYKRIQYLGINLTKEVKDADTEKL